MGGSSHILCPIRQRNSNPNDPVAFSPLLIVAATENRKVAVSVWRLSETVLASQHPTWSPHFVTRRDCETEASNMGKHRRASAIENIDKH